MSKSLGNVVNPDDIIDDYGADAMRLYEMFMGPLAEPKPWNTHGLEGVYRFLGRVWRMFITPEGVLDPSFHDDPGADPDSDLLRRLHRTIRAVTDDIESLRFNTAISQLMIFVNETRDLARKPTTVFETFVLLLAPFAPHLAEELWERLGHDTSLALSPWPKADETWLHEETVTVVVMVNGRLRDRIRLPAGAPEAQTREAALAGERVRRHLEGKTIRRVVVVPDKIVNIAAS